MSEEYFEMAYAEDTEEVIKATQRAVVSAMQKVIADMKGDIKAPGLTWEQIEYFLEEFKKKEPTVIHQEHEV